MRNGVDIEICGRHTASRIMHKDQQSTLNQPTEVNYNADKLTIIHVRRRLLTSQACSNQMTSSEWTGSTTVLTDEVPPTGLFYRIQELARPASRRDAAETIASAYPEKRQCCATCGPHS